MAGKRRGSSKHGVKKVGMYASGRRKPRAVFQSTRNAGTSKGLFKLTKARNKAYVPKKYKKYVRSSGIMYNPK